MKVGVVAGLMALLPWNAPGAWAGGGVVALQTAAPSCASTGHDRYVDCGNGTVTDTKTGLVWLKNANCIGAAGGGTGNPKGQVDWFTAMELVAGLSDKPATSAAANQDCGLSDGSSPGEWRLPSVEELEAMIADAVALGCVDSAYGGPSMTNDSGTSCWQEGPGSSFSGVVSFRYWSTTPLIWSPESFAWFGYLSTGDVISALKSYGGYVWPVRGGQ